MSVEAANPLPQLIVFSGAGLSAESGLPTFRGDHGLWEGFSLDVVCNIATWEKNFDAVHDFYNKRRLAAAGAKPNHGHLAIAEWQKRWPGRVHILTQNIDGLLEAAGCTDVIHLHGRAGWMHCTACNHEWEIGAVAYDQSGCPLCGKKKSVKPAVVFFGQAAPEYEKLYDIAEKLRSIDTALVVGTSGTVLPADRIFGRRHAFSILANLEPGHDMNESVFDDHAYGPATETLPSLTPLLARRMESAR